MGTNSRLARDQVRDDGFRAFAASNESRLRQALCASLGSQAGRDAAAEALAYGWEHWDRVSQMTNPVGYLFKLGRSRGRRTLRRRDPVLIVDSARLPEFEPGLPGALSGLSERQRLAVTLVHCFEWSLGEVAEHLGVSKGTVQRHLDRGMASLRRELGVV